jgi:hypothetical protein
MKLLNHLGTALAVVLAGAAVVRATIPTTGLVARYDLNGNANDSIAGNNGTIHGSNIHVTSDHLGHGSSAYSFDGSTDYIEIPDSDALSVSTTGYLTISIWVRADGTSLDANNNLLFNHKEGSGYVYYLGKGVGTGTSGQEEWAFRIYSADNTESPNRVNRMSYYLFNLAGGLGAGSYVQETVTRGVWMHFVAVIDSAADTITWYKNGVQKDQDPFHNSQYNITPQNGTSPMRIGTKDFNSYFAGALDNLLIYNRALTLTEIQQIYNDTSIW